MPADESEAGQGGKERRSQPPRKTGNIGRNVGADRFRGWGLLGVGMELGMVVAVMSLGGWWVDRKLDTSPWFLLLGLGIATIGGMYNLYRQSKRYFED
ncbi:MAG: AtpZ/AtpI family protein [Phycisphaeraceae bacterium]|nr:AtpZ/AtpI family protein [Phycisphaeraceae bacterium]